MQYDKGQGIAEDEHEAFIWYQKAADKNHPIAISNLGIFFERGVCASPSLIVLYCIVFR